MAARGGPQGVTAEVIGTQIYAVSMDWSQIHKGRIEAHCTCPYFAADNMCKHLWAFTLWLDENGMRPAHLPQGPLKLGSSKGLHAVDIDTAVVATTRSDWRRAMKKSASQTAFERASHEIFIVFSSDDESDHSVRLSFYTADRDADGDWSSPKPMSLMQTGELRHGGQRLRELLKTLSTLAMGELALRDRYLGYRNNWDLSSRVVSLNSLRFVLSDLLETKKIFASVIDLIRSLHSDEDLSLKSARFSNFNLVVTEIEGGHLLSGTVQMLSGQEMPVTELQMFAEPNLFRVGSQLGFLDLSETDQSWFEELSNGSLTIPHEDTEPFLETLFNQNLKAVLPPSLNWPRVSVLSATKVELTHEKETGRYRIDLKFQYGSRVISYWDSLSELVSAEQQCVYTRDRSHEDRAYGLLPIVMMFCRRDEKPYIHAKNLFAFVKEVLTAGLPVSIENKNVQEANDFQVSVSSGVDWFDVDGQAEFQGRWVKVPSILEAIHRGENFVPLPDGSIGLLNESLMKRLEKLAAFAESDGTSLRFSESQGWLLSSLLEEEQNLKIDAKFRELRQKVQHFTGVVAADPVSSFQGTLRKYQREGLGWLEFLDTFGLGGILADDMGLGKTIQCLAFLEGRRVQNKNHLPNLLLAPKSVLENWQLEAEKFTPQMKVLIHAGQTRAGSKTLFKKYDLVVTTYQTMLRDIELLKELKWDCVIIDEAQAIKNPQALVARAAKLLPAQFRLAMTGTPIENSLQDLFSISDFVNPGFLNGKRRSAHLKVNDDVRGVLTKAFKPVVLRRTKEQVLKDLPEKTEQLISVELEPKQLKTYNELKRFYQRQLLQEIKQNGIQKSQIQILAALTRLRQAALHPGLIDPAHAQTKSSKFEVMLVMLEEIISQGHRVLIFSQFTSLLALLKKELDERKIEFCYLDGQTTKRQAVVNDFKESSCPVFLMSLKAGGVGLNLVEANYVFLLDPWWNPAVEAQAIDRVHRIGQKRAVNAYRFIAKDTVEEKILELQKTKRHLSSEILGQKSGPIRSLTAEDIAGLFD